MSANSFMWEIASTHGPHHVAQNSSTITFPRNPFQSAFASFGACRSDRIARGGARSPITGGFTLSSATTPVARRQKTNTAQSDFMGTSSNDHESACGTRMLPRLVASSCQLGTRRRFPPNFHRISLEAGVFVQDYVFVPSVTENTGNQSRLVDRSSMPSGQIGPACRKGMLNRGSIPVRETRRLTGAPEYEWVLGKTTVLAV